jgi:superfamily I DNA/RNA helicase
MDAARTAIVDVLNVPKRYLTAAYINAVRTTQFGQEETLGQLLRRIADQQKLGRGSMRNVLELSHFIDSCRRQTWQARLVQLYALLKESWDDIGEAHENDGAAILDALRAFSSRYAGSTDFLEFVDKAQRIRAGTQEGPFIVLSTIHRAKGLEWDHVYVDATEGLLPHKKAVTREQQDEEQRLFYVAITRPKTKLTIVYCEKQDGSTSRDTGGLSSLVPKDFVSRSKRNGNE